jgi:hypothetical protein
MKSQPNDPEWLLKDPHSRKWMVQCAGCRRWGYTHDAPAEFFNRSHLAANFEEFKFDSRGLCGQCSQASPDQS